MSNPKSSQKSYNRRIHIVAGGKARLRKASDAGNIHITPPETIQRIRRVFGGRIGLDPCTLSTNPVGADVFYTEDDDGLVQPWDEETIFVNPPYNPIGEWIRCAMKAAQAGSRVVFLAPARIDAPHSQRLIRASTNMVMIAGRLRFLKPDGTRQGSPTFGSILFGLNQSLVGLSDLGVLVAPVRIKETKKCS